jgi:hypothetical protein
VGAFLKTVAMLGYTEESLPKNVLGTHNFSCTTLYYQEVVEVLKSSSSLLEAII